MADERGVAARVILAMRNVGMTQAELAHSAELTEDKLSKSLHGKRRFTSLDLALIAEATNSRVDDLLGMHMADPAVFAAQTLTRGILAALDYAEDTSKGDWQISYHEAAQWMCGILRNALKDSLDAPLSQD